MTTKSDHQIIRDYITGADHLQYAYVPEGTVCINMTHSNLPPNHPDLRLSLHMTISEVKEKFRFHTGTPVDAQRLLLRDNGRLICEINDNTKKLGYYSVESGMEIHIIDTDPFSLSRNGGLTDVSLVQKYKMSDEDYDQRKGTLRDHIRQQKKLNPNFKLGMKSDANAETVPNPGPESVEGISVGMRCEVSPGGRRGVVKYVGEIPNSPTGFWVGVQYDEPVGKGDGTAKGNVLFECPMRYGGFVRGKNIQVGDFPERGFDDEEDERDDSPQKEDDEEF